jgi:HSP20 family molecular chaperone IbpA
VSGETKFSKGIEEIGYAVKEMRFGKFSRTLLIPAAV